MRDGITLIVSIDSSELFETYCKTLALEIPSVPDDVKCRLDTVLVSSSEAHRMLRSHWLSAGVLCIPLLVAASNQEAGH